MRDSKTDEYLFQIWELDIIESTYERIQNEKNGRGYLCGVRLRNLLRVYDRQNGCCALSGARFSEKIWGKPSLDRINSKYNYTEDNIQWITGRINLMKGSMDEELFIDLCLQISLNSRRSQIISFKENFSRLYREKFRVRGRFSRKLPPTS